MMIRGNGVDVWTPQTVTAGINSNISRIANYLGGTGTVSEVIIYTTDQTDNRKALESNMADFYGIDLDAAADHDSGEDQVDGFVATWYDQSGEGNDATQAVSTSQPKIVDAGSLVEDGNLNGSTIWDGVDDDLDPQNGFAGVTSANVYAVTDNAGVVTIDTLTAQDISAKTDLSSVLTGLTYGKVTATIIYPDATNQSGIETTLSGLFET